MRTRGGSLLIVASAVLAGLPAWGGTEKPKEEKVEGYVEWRQDGCLLVDAQRVCTTTATRWKGGGGATGLDQVPFGWEVKAKGLRRADGAIEAREIEAKPNGMAMFEGEVLKVTSDAEDAYREAPLRRRRSGAAAPKAKPATARKPRARTTSPRRRKDTGSE